MPTHPYASQAIRITTPDGRMIDEDQRAHFKALKKLKKQLALETKKADKAAKKQKAPDGTAGTAPTAVEKPEPLVIDEVNHYGDFRMSRWPAGVLLIHVVQAKGLPVADISVGVSIDPYFRLVRRRRRVLACPALLCIVSLRAAVAWLLTAG